MKWVISVIAAISTIACGTGHPQTTAHEVHIEQSSVIVDGYLIQNFNMALSENSWKIIQSNVYTLETNVPASCHPVFFIRLIQLSLTQNNKPIPSLPEDEKIELQTIRNLDNNWDDAVRIEIKAQN
ncbi:MAG TPA: hypothetical protein VFO10_06550 [Oligoflexus sp.]|uniref:hypothetical protein n=1 Tax=Oligoflexus sp. TaxID=1971216 RepID=UPI002D7FCB6E|nr:hypothetical protein [Oligoflexus sp.]HET9236891.1 hypothetical protein [Oligoflexus sp.]